MLNRASFKRLVLVGVALAIPAIAYASVSVTLNGTNYTIPQNNEKGWGTQVTNWITAASQHLLQKTGGVFTLSAETDFGGSYGLKTAYLKSETSNLSATGWARLANSDGIGWRNIGNSADLLLKPNTSTDGVLQYNAVDLLGASLTQTVTNKTISGASNTLSNIPMTSVTGTLATTNGGTGQNSTATFPTSGTVATVPSSGVVRSSGSALTTGSVALATEVSGTLGIGNGGTGQTSFGTGILKSNGSALSSAAVGLASADVTGTLGLGNGGTGQTTKAAAFDALSPMTTSGDIIYGGASGTGTRLAKGSDTQVLTLAGGVPTWASPAAATYAYFYGYLDSTRSFTTTATSLANPTVLAAATSLNTVASSNMGTVAQFTATSNWYPGIVVTPVVTGKYEVTVTVNLEQNTANAYAIAGLYDDTSSVLYDTKLFRAYVSNAAAELVLVGIIPMTAATAKTLMVQIAASAGTTSILSSNANITRVITWSIKFVGT